MKIIKESRERDMQNLGKKDGNRVSDVLEIKVKYELSQKYKINPSEVEKLYEDEYYDLLVVFERAYLEGFQDMMPHPFLDI